MSRPNGARKHKKIWIVLAVLLVLGALSQRTSERSLPRDSVTPEPDPTPARIESAGGIYLGPVVELAYEGEGTFQHLDGGVYTGSFANSKREGEGVFTWSNGDSFTGTWSEDQMVKGEYLFADGRRYRGTFSDHTFETGTFSRPEDEQYLTFQAAYEDGVITKLTLETVDGLRYQGDLSGKAEITYATGNTYQGQVDQGKRDGTGTFTWITDGTETASYEGAWVQDVMTGSGIYHYSASRYPYLEGEFAGGRPEGQAVYYQKAGTAFTTTWTDGQCIQVQPR